ncbi:MAG TPA: urea ABC transporter permease subunit UrtB [Casimicrobiaceae bacterium]|jgi:urea transport system permease protein|nr:urea ABC transporter permease subunit UrtB [Casimicrobiaceae bacterium]
MKCFVAALVRACLASAVALLTSSATAAVDPQTIRDLAFGESDDKIKAIGALSVGGDPLALPLLQALLDGEVQTVGENQVLLVKGETATDLLTGKTVSPLPENRDDVVVNNRVRRGLGTAIAALKLSAPDRSARLHAAKELQNSADEDTLPAITTALAKESDAEIKELLSLTQASIHLASKDRATRIAAIRTLAESSNPSTKTLLLGVLEQKGGSYVEADAEVRSEADKSLRAVETKLATGELIGRIFSGVSLGSVLLLAALGLAITYGLMGVINLAHGELIMIGAYATYVVQNLFRRYAPGAFDAYLICAVPMAFAAAGLVGIALERSVIRFLYGRPLETLLATWGISLILMQAVRTIFGAQNVLVENPSWMSGGFVAMTGIVLPWSRIAIIAFAALVLLLIWLLLTRTRLGLFVRAVTQNRAMASCTGVPTRRVDTLAFGLGAGVAGLAGCALSQIGNVGPDLGQSYIVDSFMVVVLGGVGQLAGTVYAALGLGIVNKLLEAWSGAVLAKIAVLVFIIFFIQKRPQGLFALKGRAMET